MTPTITDAPAEELPLVRSGALPGRYGVPMQHAFLERVLPVLTPGSAVLDVGAGRAPTVAPAARPAGCRYVGVDISADELSAAAPGAYDDSRVHDVTLPLPPDLGRFDVVLSWQVLEHVSSTESAFAAMYDALRPGGTLVAQLSGTFASFAVAARFMPHALRSLLMERMLGMPAEEKFPVRYDRCWASALERTLSGWSAAEITPFYRGATYLNRLPRLRRLYLGYETTMERRRVANAATHYLIVARR